MENFDFIGFTYNGKHSYRDLGIYRTIDGSRYNNNLTATLTEKTSEVPGGDGQYYFGTTLKNRTFTVQFAFDSLTETQLRQLKQEFNGEGIHDLIFDEEPYKVWSAKVTGTASLKHICFEVGGQRVYKGEGSITFTCYYPYAHTPTKLWKFEEPPAVIEENTEGGENIEKPVINIIYAEADGRILNNYNDDIYSNKNEWSAASGLEEKELTKVGGDVPTTFIFTIKYDIDDNGFPDVDLKEINVGGKILCCDINIPDKKELTWNSKTGLLLFNDSPIYYTGEGCVKIAPNSDWPTVKVKIGQIKDANDVTKLAEVEIANICFHNTNKNITTFNLLSEPEKINYTQLFTYSLDLPFLYR